MTLMATKWLWLKVVVAFYLGLRECGRCACTTVDAGLGRASYDRARKLGQGVLKWKNKIH